MTLSWDRPWAPALLLALGFHLAVSLMLLSLPAAPPTFRGGSLFDMGGESSESSAGVFVMLGQEGESAGEQPIAPEPEAEAEPVEPLETLAQGEVAGQDEPGSAAEEAPPVPEPEPVTAEVAEQTVDPEADQVGEEEAVVEAPQEAEAPVTAPPVPQVKPMAALPAPEIEGMGRRLSVQPPPQAAAPGKPAESASGVDFANMDSRVGTASGNTIGEIRELNYQDRVMLWLKRHGAYPRDAARYRLEDTVMLHFAIARDGRILHYDLVQPSKYDLLNRAVRRMMDRSSPVPPIPAEIGKDQLTFTVPVRFSVDAS